MAAKSAELDHEQEQLLAKLGERLRIARLRRRLTAEEVAGRAGITRMTLYRLERGEPALAVGTLVKVMSVLGLQASVAELARDDSAGHQLQDEELARRRPPLRRRIPIDRYPQLRRLAWNIASGTEITPEEAFSLYERNWRHLDRSAMNAREREFLRRLQRTVGKGVMLV